MMKTMLFEGAELMVSRAGNKQQRRQRTLEPSAE